MRILHVIDSIDERGGGTVEVVRQRCILYQMAGHTVEVASMDSPDAVRNCPFPAPVFGLGPGRGVYGYSRKAARWFRDNLCRFDLVIISGIWQYGAFASYRALAGKNIPYAVFAHGMLDPYFKRGHPLKHAKKLLYWLVILRRILRNANAVLFACEGEKLLARESFFGYHARELVVPFGAFGPDCNLRAAADEFFSRWPQLAGKRLALFLGRIHPKKGIEILIEAFAGSLARDPDWHLVLAGPDQIGWRKDLEALVTRLGIADRITWTGMLTGTMKWGAFAASEVFVLPSHQENFGVAVAEALSCGLPVILSYQVNIWREIESYWAGLACEDTIEGIGASLQRWSKLAPPEIAAVRLRSRKCFDELFSLDAATKSVQQNIGALLRANLQLRA